MDILNRIRNTTVADLAGVRADFDDDTSYVWSPKRPKEMVRIVEGADDLQVSIARADRNAGMVAASDRTGEELTAMYEAPGHDDNGCVAPCCTPAPIVRDRRSEGQVRYMDNLISWITEKDQATGDAARVWTDNVTAAGKWSYDKADKFSISAWIDRLKAKNAELNTIVKATPSAPASPISNVAHSELPARNDKSGKPMPMYYAVDMDGTTKFYRVKPGTKPGYWWIDAQASDAFHPIRNVSTKNTILRAIIDAGADSCMGRYGQLIGSCGRCHKTLTDADSRARGIGPDCLGKM